MITLSSNINLYLFFFSGLNNAVFSEVKMKKTHLLLS